MSAGAESRLLGSLGVPPETIALLGRDDVDALAGEVERFVAYGYGQASQRCFMTSPHQKLRFRTPVEALATPGSPAEVLALVRAQLAALEQAR